MKTKEQIDAHPTKRWCGGTECYERRYRCRVPGDLMDDEIDEWVYQHEGRLTWLD